MSSVNIIESSESSNAGRGAAPLEFEPVNSCMLCGGTEQHDAQGVSWDGIGFSYCYCGRCGLKYMRPRPTQGSYQAFYENNFWQQKMAASGFATVDGFDDARVNQLELRMPKYKSGYARLKRHLSEVMKLNSDTRVLEVGCAFGFSLEWLKRDYGCQVFGIEPSADARERCQDVQCISLVAKTAEELFCDVQGASVSDQYDLIFFKHSLENMTDPMPILSGVRERLTPSGILLVYTPNVEYFDSMNPYHPYIYSPETILRLLRLCGLEVFKLDASPTPVSRSAAISVLNPSYEIAVFARRGNAQDMPLAKVDPIELSRCHRYGKEAMIWNKLTTQDMARRILIKAWDKLKRIAG